MRVVVTGQVGLDKRPLLERVRQVARGEGYEVDLLNVGQMMYTEAPDVPGGRILDLPLSRLNSLRRSVFKDVLAASQKNRHVLVNTHATFRWRHGLFYAFDYDQMKALDADLYITVVDNIDRLQYRLLADGHADHTLKDLMVWREEEILATELLSQIVRGHGCHFILARGADGDLDQHAHALVRLMLGGGSRKAYLSFPMSHVMDRPAVLEEIDGFRRLMKRHFVCFDPGDVEEKQLCKLALEAAQEGRRSIEVGPAGEKAVLETSQLLDIIADIDGQIYARDFKLIDQSDMIVSLIPEIDGRPAISSGVERELQHAHESAKEVFVIWPSAAPPSPFITETATELFHSSAQAIDYFLAKGFVPKGPSGTLFTL